MHDISLSSARRLALRAQGLDGGWKLPAGREGAARTIEHLGYVQIDTIAVIQRAHDHVLWTRRPGYDPAMLDALLASERRVFEYWAHAAAYLPFADYRYYLPRMRAAATRPRLQKWRRANARLVAEVLARIRAEGALGSADFEHAPGQRGPWWDWKPAKRALESLFDTGELLVSARRHFQRLYDLPERVVPAHIDTSEPGPEEVDRHFTRRALHAHGLATLRQLRKPFDNEGAERGLRDLLSSGEAVEVRVEGQGAPFYALAEALHRQPRPRQKRLHLLSPFDNLVIDRERLLQLFAFDYKIECYTPAAKRRYGYFTLPILWGDELVGRLDPKAERKGQVLYLRNLVFEPAFADGDALLPALAEKLRAFAAFNGCLAVRVEKCAPARLLPPLRRALDAL